MADCFMVSLVHGVKGQLCSDVTGTNHAFYTSSLFVFTQTHRRCCNSQSLTCPPGLWEAWVNRHSCAHKHKTENLMSSSV